MLDDGLTRLLGVAGQEAAQRRLVSMLQAARDEYGAETALLACAMLSRESLERLRAEVRYPLVKLDEPMARNAVAAADRIGIVVTYPPAGEVTRELLMETAIEVGEVIEVEQEAVPDAMQALLHGDLKRHDSLLVEAAARVAQRDIQAIVLAQLSMVRIRVEVAEATKLPVFTSLSASLDEIRRILDPPGPKLVQ